MPDDLRRWQAQRYAVLRIVLLVIGVSLAVVLALVLMWNLRRIVGYVLIAGFFAVVLNPAVDALTRLRLRRGMATGIVFFLGVAVFSALTYSFVRPVVSAGQRFADDIPGFVERAERGEGRVGELIQRYDIDEFARENAPKLRQSFEDAGGPAVRTVQRIASGVFAVLTILVLAFLVLLEAPGIINAALAVLSPERAEQVRRIGRDASRAVTGYMAGNLVISIIAGAASYLALRVIGVPFANVLGLWVGFADLLPMIGATVGAVPAVLIALLDSTGSGVATLVWFVLYQQFENHVLQMAVMSRTVRLNPLLVLLSVLVGLELAGFVGALLAIPGAGVIQVVVRDVWDERQARLKPVPTVGVDEVPVLPPPATITETRPTGTA